VANGWQHQKQNSRSRDLWEKWVKSVLRLGVVGDDTSGAELRGGGGAGAGVVWGSNALHHICPAVLFPLH